MANRFLSNIRINDAYTFPASDGSSGQVITTDGAGNLSFAESGTSDAASVIYRDNFTGDGSTVAFDLQNSITDEDQTQIYIDGVYQEKDTYSVSGSTITFTTAPISGHSIEVISISAINTGPTIIYQDNFTGNGSATDFTLAQVIDNEVKTFVFLNGVYQFKGTYSVDSTTLSFDTAPVNGVDIEVISIASATQGDSLQAGAVIIPVKNTHTSSISKGTPVYITGNVGASERLQIAPADASNSAKMPAAGLLLTTLAVNELGYAITGGYLRNITTDTIDGTSTTSNDTVYVKAGGGLTMTKPTGSNLIQNIAKVARSASGSAGSLIVSSILRTNDIPNLTTGKIWVGDSNTVESTVIHLDESNNRLGINNTSPSYSLDVTGDANISSNVIVGGNLTVQGTETILNTQTVEVEDNILQLNTTQGSPDTATATTSGISIYRGNGVTQASFIFDDADDTWDLTNNLIVDGNVDINAGVLNIGASRSTYIDASEDSTATGHIFVSNDAVGDFSQLAGNLIIQARIHPTVYRDIIFAGGLNTAEALMTIQGEGNVGIGTTNPTKKLTVFGTGAGNAIVQIEGEGGADPYINFLANNTQHWSLGIDDSDSDKFKLSEHSALGTNDYLVVDTSGNVGIGTTSPSSKLEVISGASHGTGFTQTRSGHPSFSLLSGGTNSVYLGIAPDSGSYSTFMQVVEDGTDINYIRFNTGASTERMRIDSSGTTMITKTQVTSSFDTTSFLRLHPSTTVNSGGFTNMFFGTSELDNFGISLGGLRAGTNGVPTFIIKTHNNDATGTERMRIDNSGHIYQGTVGEAANKYYYFQNSTTADAGLVFKDNASTNSGYLTYNHGQDAMKFGVNGSERMRIDSSGRVGINETSPDALLDIELTDTNTYDSSALNTATLIAQTFNTSNVNSQASVISLRTTGWAGGTTGVVNLAAIQAGNANSAHFVIQTRNGGTYGERMRIESDGDVILTEGNLTMSGATPFIVLSNTAETESGITFVDSADPGQSAKITYDASSNKFNFYNNSSSVRMVIDSSGNILIGKTAYANANEGIVLRSAATSGGQIRLTRQDNTGTQTNVGFYVHSGSNIGTITTTSSSVAYNTSSDYRLKEDLQDFAGLDMVSKIPVYDFKWKSNESRSYGVMAHELQEVLPQAVSGKKDAEEMQGVDYSKIVPLLVKSIQELKAEIKLLKIQINN